MTSTRPGSGGDRPPAVVLVLDALALNGAVRIAVRLAERWQDAVLAVVRDLPPADRIALPPGSPVRQLVPHRLRSFAAAPVALHRLWRLARAREVVLAGSEIGAGLALAYLAARAARRPLVIGVHADLDDALEEWMAPVWHRPLRWIHRHADHVICVEEALVAPLLRNGLSIDRMSVVLNGIDVGSVRAAADEPDPFPALAGPRVVATGRLAPQKATDLLVRAHAAVVTEHPHTLVVLNDGPEEQALRSLIDRLGVASTVIIEKRSPPHAAVARSVVFCLPSRHEGLPLALLEAIAVGTPCIAADCSAGVRDALDGGRAGALFPVGDLDALAAALRAHLADPRPLQRAAARASARLARFDEEAMARGWADALCGVVGRSAPAHPLAAR